MSSSSPNAASVRTPPTPPRPGPRPPLHVQLLAVLSLLIGLLGAVGALAELNGALLHERDSYIRAVQQRQLARYDDAHKQEAAQAQGAPSQGQGQGPDQGQAATAQSRTAAVSPLRPLFAPLLKLPREEISRLSLLLGDELHERQRVMVPLSLLQLILSWLLMNGALGTLRRQPGAASTWSWACTVNIPFSLLALVVMFMHARQMLQRLGQPAAEALAKVSGRPVDRELDDLRQLMREFVMLQSMASVLGVLLLGATALVVQHYIVKLRRLEGEAAPRPGA